MEILINTIRVERARHQITQRELSVAINCSLMTISAIENRKFNPSTLLSLKIVRFFNELKFETNMKLIVIEDIFKLEAI